MTTTPASLTLRLLTLAGTAARLELKRMLTLAGIRTHLRRDWQKWVDRGGEAKPLGRALLGQTTKLFELYHKWRQGTLPHPVFQLRMSEVEAAVARLLRKAQVCPDQKVAGMAVAIIKLEPALWAFVHMEEVEPTNNRAERALRPAVYMRKGSFGTHSPEGSRYIERMLTAVTTLKSQQRNVLDYRAAPRHCT